MNDQANKMLRETHRARHQFRRLKSMYDRTVYCRNSSRMRRLNALIEELKFRADMTYSIWMDMML